MCTYCVNAVTREVCRICAQPSTTLKCFTWPIMSMIFVFSLTQMSVVLYLYVMLSIHISFFPFWYVGLQVCSVLVLVSVHFCIIYVTAGSTHELHTCLSRQMARLLLKRFRCLAYAAQPDMILRFSSLS